MIFLMSAMFFLATLFYIYLVWSIIEPEEAFLFLNRWRYKTTPEVSDLQKKIIRITSAVSIVILTLVIILTAIDMTRPDPLQYFLDSQH